MAVTAKQAASPDEPYAVLDDTGQLLAGAKEPAIPAEDLKRLYRGLLLVRIMDDRMLRLQRQGRLGFYMTSTGEEATHFGGAYPLTADDWVFPSYREPGAAFWRGYTLKEFICQLFGNSEDLVKGRQMPVHHACRRINYVSISSPVGTQIPQAVGAGWAAKISKKSDVALVYFGEGATSTGQFHVGMNFAGVYKAPTIFFCRNNGWAISTSRDRQTAAKTFAAKAIGYGMPGIRVDGNDLLAIINVMTTAVQRARDGEGPTMIEAVTYRRGGHSSSDDPSVYRDPNEPKKWEPRDPITRFKGYLEAKGLWTEAWDQQQREEINSDITEALRAAEAAPPPEASTLFDDVFVDLPWHLREQKQLLLDEIAAAGGVRKLSAH